MLHCCGKKLLMKSKSWLTIITSSQVEWEGVSFQAGLKSFSSISLSLSLSLSPSFSLPLLLFCKQRYDMFSSFITTNKGLLEGIGWAAFESPLGVTLTRFPANRLCSPSLLFAVGENGLRRVPSLSLSPLSSQTHTFNQTSRFSVLKYFTQRYLFSLKKKQYVRWQFHLNILEYFNLCCLSESHCIKFTFPVIIYT